MDDLTVILIYVLVGLIGLIAGIVVGVLVANQFRENEPPGPKRSRSLTEVASIWRDRRNNALCIEIGGELYHTPENLSVKRYAGLARLLEELQNWLGVPETEKRAAPVPSQKLADSKRVISPISQPVQETPPEKATPTSAPLPPVIPLSTPISPLSKETRPVNYPGVPEEIQPASTNPIKAFARAFRPKVKDATPPPRSIAAQIDEILQEKLPLTPLSKHVIRLIELPERGIVVVVDNQQYEGVSEVPDPEIRSLLQACAAEWEQRIGN